MSIVPFDGKRSLNLNLLHHTDHGCHNKSKRKQLLDGTVEQKTTTTTTIRSFIPKLM